MMCGSSVGTRRSATANKIANSRLREQLEDIRKSRIRKPVKGGSEAIAASAAQ
jgi:hypothetical protein